MPIKRLQREASVPCIGHLRKGGEKRTNASGNEIMGKDLDYFRFDTDDERAEKMFAAAYGKEPTAINVFLPHQGTDENFSAWQEHWKSGGLQHRCDGEVCVIWYDGATGKYSHEPKPCPGGCKEVGRLQVIIPELQRFAYVTAETHSIHDIMTITENLQAIEARGGDLRGIPFILRRAVREISTPGPNNTRVRRAKSLLSIEVDPAWAALQLDAMHRDALGLSPSQYTQPAGYLEDGGEDLEDVEFSEVVEDAPEPQSEALALLMAAIAGFYGDNADAHIAEIEAKKKKSIGKMTDKELRGWQAWIEQQADAEPS